jgi:hypothetical protein
MANRPVVRAYDLIVENINVQRARRVLVDREIHIIVRLQFVVGREVAVVDLDIETVITVGGELAYVGVIVVRTVQFEIDRIIGVVIETQADNLVATG